MKSNEKYRRGIFVIPYSIENKKVFYLLLKRKLHWIGWEFTKGGVEKGENLISTAKRELKEETGKRYLSIKKFKISGKYKYDKVFENRRNRVGQTYEYTFAAEINKKGKVNFDKKEHSGFKWLEFDEAIEKLTWDNQKKCLKIVNDWIIEKIK